MARLTKDFKREAGVFILNKSIELVLSLFENDRQKNDIMFNDDVSKIIIRKNCFQPAMHASGYWEDYNVKFITTFKGETIVSYFYLEWDGDKLVPDTFNGVRQVQNRIYKYKGRI